MCDNALKVFDANRREDRVESKTMIEEDRKQNEDEKKKREDEETQRIAKEKQLDRIINFIEAELSRRDAEAFKRQEREDAMNAEWEAGNYLTYFMIISSVHEGLFFFAFLMIRK